MTESPPRLSSRSCPQAGVERPSQSEQIGDCRIGLWQFLVAQRARVKVIHDTGTDVLDRLKPISLYPGLGHYIGFLGNHLLDQVELVIDVSEPTPQPPPLCDKPLSIDSPITMPNSGAHVRRVSISKVSQSAAKCLQRS